MDSRAGKLGARATIRNVGALASAPQWLWSEASRERAGRVALWVRQGASKSESSLSLLGTADLDRAVLEVAKRHRSLCCSDADGAADATAAHHGSDATV